MAALLIEPVLGNGGNIVPPPGYYRAIREICDRLGILIIADEVQTGIRTHGTFFASAGYRGSPQTHILTFAKGAGGIGIPVAGVVMRKELDILETWSTPRPLERIPWPSSLLRKPSDTSKNTTCWRTSRDVSRTQAGATRS